MTRVAVVLADGFEEIEALAPVDVFRRAHFDCQIVGLDSHEVEDRTVFVFKLTKSLMETCLPLI